MRDKYKLKFKTGFTLLELLVVIAIISLLMAVIVPAMNRVREQAKSVVCRSNLKQVGVAILASSLSDSDRLPVSYDYRIKGYEKSGYEHWSSQIMLDDYVGSEVFHCPSIKGGGLSPANTDPVNLEPGQTVKFDGVIDDQASKCAFVLNEALCPRNRFSVGFEGAQTTSRKVKLSNVMMSDKTILATEYCKDWEMLADYSSGFCMSYLPVHGFECLGVKGGDPYDLNMASVSTPLPCFKDGPFMKLSERNLMGNPVPGRKNPARLNYVGRNHFVSKNSDGVNNGKSSFLYSDGHVGVCSVYETLEDFQWGKRIYSIKGNNRVQKTIH